MNRPMLTASAKLRAALDAKKIEQCHRARGARGQIGFGGFSRSRVEQQFYRRGLGFEVGFD